MRISVFTGPFLTSEDQESNEILKQASIFFARELDPRRR
jgi:hypothetical protein